MIHISLLIYKC